MKQFKVRIVYKSGFVLEDWFTEFKVEKRGPELVSISMRFVDENKHGFFIGINDIESVFQLEAK